MMSDIFGIHEQALLLRGQRTQLIANNIANAETPGYLARDIDFKQVLSQYQTSQLQDGSSDSATLLQTHPLHQAGLLEAESLGGLSYRIPNQPAQDGNTVDVQMEKSAYLDNAMRFQASLQFLNGRIQSLKAAFRGE